MIGDRKLALAGGMSLVMALVLLATNPARAHERPDLEAAKKRYAEIVAAELDRKILPGVSIAWIVDGQVVHAVGYGQADALRGVAATADTIYRAGSISKLFNAVAAVQLVEQGKLDLDAPIEKALAEFRIVVPFDNAAAITARQLLCHRSGMIREAPVGGYLDPSQPTVAATVASVAACVLVNPPNTKTRYSNVGPTIVGRALEVQTGLPYAEYQQRYVLGPLGMTSSAWRMSDALRPRLARGLMRVARGGGYVFEPAPEFELGTIPAGNLYTTANDLARFASFMMGGTSPAEPTSPILTQSSLEKMYVPQLTGEPTGFGLGFSVGRYREHKTVQHNGAVYGFSTSLVVLPEEKIGAIVLSNADIAGAGVKRLSEAALDLLLQAVRGEAIGRPPQPVDLSSEALAELAGEYESTSYWARLTIDGKTLGGEFSGQPIALTSVAPLKFLADGRIMAGSPFVFERAAGRVTGFTAAGQHFARIEPGTTPRPPAACQPLVGSYGESFIPLVISIRHGHLYATVENEYDYRLAPLNRVTFNLPPGMYADEQVVFQTDASGKIAGVVMANMYLPRRRD
jgi:CubicO group peptidase (beta-lactamase class C family)